MAILQLSKPCIDPRERTDIRTVDYGTLKQLATVFVGSDLNPAINEYNRRAIAREFRRREIEKNTTDNFHARMNAAEFGHEWEARR